MDWQLTCRVCLETGDMVSIFDWDENNEQLSDKYTFCCGVEVSKNDTLPTLICLNCVDRLTFAYQFKQQCLSSNDTLKECLEEFKQSSAAASATKASKVVDVETITIKQENGLLLQYELPVEHDPQVQWSRASSTRHSSKSKKRGRPRKYVDEQGLSLYRRKKAKQSKEKDPEELTTMITNATIDMKEEPVDEEEPFGGDFADNDPDYAPDDIDEKIETEAEVEPEKSQSPPKKRGRRRKSESKSKPKETVKEDDGEDVLLKETILAFSEPIPEHILNPKPKKRYTSSKKKYVYEKTHTCETCGTSFTSNSALQTHIRRHLGIKPFVCSVCGFACVMKEPLKRHMLRHTGERPYKCRICERRFGDYGTRQKHERLHMGIRPYQCTLCGKSFTYSYVLANHMLTHTGEKKYSCGPCNKKFTKAHHLKYHNKVHHKELYMQQQMELEAKRMRQQMNITSLGGVAGQVIDGSLQLIQTTDDAEETQMQIVQDDDKETNRAVAGMQGVVLDNDFCIQDE
ncbi:zinc finger protein 391 isoform X1 [Bombyx mori]|uniref:Protein hunchback n=1 Tax=Bombyx mori TaxID=7091 RepID=A0A8R2ARP9_BOMMO|nr:zinc finger protein 391 isoform X1 [Bombyx mori]